MKKMLMIMGVVGWLVLPVIWCSAYLETKRHLDESTMTLIRLCKAQQGLELDGEPWYSCVKGFSGNYVYRIRDRYLLPLGMAWLAAGCGLAAAFWGTKRACERGAP